MNTLYVADGNWILHRAFYTINPKHRDPLSALLYMFCHLLMQDALRLRASHFLLAFDGPKVFRYKLYPQYKANRSKNTTESETREGFKDIYEYLNPICAIFTELGIPWIQPDIFEADDVLCSAVKKFASADCFVYCGTQDKDSYQYLNQYCALYDSSHKVNGQAQPLIIDCAKAEQIKKVKCSQMAAYQCLIGDAIDNIPRILTPTEARKLLSTYGSIKDAIAQGYDLTTKLCDLKRNAKLVTLRSDVQLPELSELVMPKKELDNELKRSLPSAYFNYVEFLHPKARSLFSR